MSKLRAAKAICAGFLALMLASLGNATAEIRAVQDGEIDTIEISGRISADDGARFDAALQKIIADPKAFHTIGDGKAPFILVDLNSPGGDLAAAMKIGRLIHDKAILVRVKSGQTCASACVFILIAGLSRTVVYPAAIALHRPRSSSESFSSLPIGDAVGSYEAMAEVAKKYFAAMGGNPRAFDIIMTTPSDKAYVLTDREITDLGMRGESAAFQEVDLASQVKEFGQRGAAFFRECQAKAMDGEKAAECYRKAKALK